jgi:tRNA 2-thiouridine synthesizing protein C
MQVSTQTASSPLAPEKNPYAQDPVKKFLVITRQAPFGSARGREALDVVLMASAFSQVSLLFLGDGIFQLKTSQNGSSLGIKDYSPAFAALEQYEVTNIMVSGPDLEERGMTTADLLIPVTTVDAQAIRQLILANDIILSF